MDTVRKYSRKREAVLSILRSTTEHPSADWVYREARRQYPDVSLATVYRNISLFRADGAVRTVAVVNGQERFDARTEDHPHFVCRTCGRVTDICGCNVSDDGIAEALGAQITGRDLTYYGICRDCLNK